VGEVKVLAEGLHFGEGPRWHDGRLWFSDFYDHAVKSVDLEGDLRIELELDGQPSGLGWLRDGRLLVVSMLDRKRRVARSQTRSPSMSKTIFKSHHLSASLRDRHGANSKASSTADARTIPARNGHQNVRLLRTTGEGVGSSKTGGGFLTVKDGMYPPLGIAIRKVELPGSWS
jgi:hypothetical protein